MDNFRYSLNDYDLYANNEATRDSVFNIFSRGIAYNSGMVLKAYIRRAAYDYNHMKNSNFLIIFDLFMKENNPIQFILEMEHEK